MNLAKLSLPRARDSVLMIAIGVSIAAHALVLAVRFVAPQAFRLSPDDKAMEVILVNAKSRTRPAKADALAQADLDGGGEHDTGRATSFVPRSATIEDGDALEARQRSVSQLEALQQRLLSQLKPSKTAVSPDAPPTRDIPTDAPTPLDVAESIKAISRMEAQIEKQVSDYNARPRRGFIGPNTRGVSYALYYTQWKDKVERVGTVNYPEEARGKIYGDLIITVTLKPDGSIFNDEVTITHSSGHKVLDRAAARIVRLAAPYGRFSPQMRKDYDVFEIITRFSFTRADGFEARIEKR